MLSVQTEINREQNERAARRWIVAVALGVSVVAFGATLSGHFLGDDFGYVQRFARFSFSEWPRLFVREWSEGMWGLGLSELRPVTALSLMIDGHLWGAHASGYRVTNVLLHAACAALVGMIAWRVAQKSRACGIVAAALFALHPVHAEPVLWITGRVDVLATLFYLAMFGAFLRFRMEGGWGALAGGVAAFAAGIFAKEFVLTAPIMLLVADAFWLTRGRAWRALRTWAPYLGCAGVAGIYFLCRRAAFGAGGTGAGIAGFNDADFWPKLAERLLTYFGHLFPPFERWVGAGTPAVAAGRVVTTFGWVAAVGAVVFVAAAILLGKRSRAAAASAAAANSRDLKSNAMPLGAALFFALGWLLVATLPLLVTYVSSRHLYLASAGVCVAAALWLRGLMQRPWPFAIAALALAGLYAERLVQTTAPWRDAGRWSSEVAREFAAVEREAKPGAAVLVDVPHTIRSAFFWEWAFPFAARPPFAREALDTKFVLLEAMPLYFDWDRWHEQPAVAKLAQVEVESWVVQMSDGVPVKRFAVPPEKLRAAAQRFVAAPRKDDPHGTWRRFIDELAKP